MTCCHFNRSSQISHLHLRSAFCVSEIKWQSGGILFSNRRACGTESYFDQKAKNIHSRVLNFSVQKNINWEPHHLLSFWLFSTLCWSVIKLQQNATKCEKQFEAGWKRLHVSVRLCICTWRFSQLLGEKPKLGWKWGRGCAAKTRPYIGQFLKMPPMAPCEFLAQPRLSPRV